MVGYRGSVAELCYAAEGLSGTAASTSLRKLGTLMDSAPSGRLFGAISTLSDMSAKASKALEEGALSMTAGDDHKAAAKLIRGLGHMDDLASFAAGPSRAEEPGYLRKSR
jgi:hypothetical protein